MIDSFVILTPFLLLGVVALLAFVGCDIVFGLQGFQPVAPAVSAVTPLTGPIQGGTLVNITGSDLPAGAMVTFGGTPATDVMGSGQVITTITPPHSSGAVDLVVTNPTRPDLFGTLSSTDPGHFTYAGVTHVQTLIVPGVDNSGGATAQANLAFADPPKLLIIAVVWPTGAGTLASLVIDGGVPHSLRTDVWSGYNVQVFYVLSVPGGSNVAVTATLSAPSSPSSWDLCVSVYDAADPASAPYAPNSANNVASSTITPISIAAIDGSDLIYALAIAQTAGGSFISGTGLSAGPRFLQEATNGAFLVEDQQITAAGPVSVTAGTAGTATGRWYIFATGIKHA